MDEFFNYYISAQVLLSLVFLLVLFLKHKTFKLSFSSLLKLNYLLILGALVLPMALHLYPSENPFGPIAKVWTEPTNNIGLDTKSNSNILLKIPSTPITPVLGANIPFRIVILGFVLIFSCLFYQLIQLGFSFRKLNQLVRSSFQIKSLGNVKILVSSDVNAPFSFFNGKANIVLPISVLDEKEKYRIAVQHEIQHHRQKDTIWVYLLELVKVLFAGNPLVQKLNQQSMQLQELACDESLVGHKNLSPLKYGKCLYDFAVKQRMKQVSPLGAVGMAAEAKFLKRRIEQMFQRQRFTSKKSYASILLVCLLGLSSAAWTFRGVVSDQKISMNQAQKLAKKISSHQKIPVKVDKKVLFWLNKAVGSEQSRKYMRESLARKEVYETMIQSRLGKSSLPQELIAVPLVESGFKNDSLSSAGAAGIWQFMPRTAQRCGLEVSSSKDERYNANRLTDAAVCYYQKLYAVFQDWHVALAAYNIGEHGMTKAISSAGHNDVFKLARNGQLGREGSNYLPKVIAGMIILKNPELVQ